MIDKKEFNRDWKFCKNNLTKEQVKQGKGKWKQVILPHTWNADDMVPESVTPYIGVTWYKKKFNIPEMLNDNRLLLEFEAIANSSQIWVDDVYVGGRNGGFLGFWIDITEALNSNNNEHVIYIKVDNSYDKNFPPPENIDWERYGGIYRPAWLYVKNNAYITYKGVQIYTPEVSHDKASIVVKSNCFDTFKNTGKYILKHTLYDPDNNIVEKSQSQINTGYYHKTDNTVEFTEVKEPQLWSVDTPVLYTLKTELLKNNKVIDKVNNRFGFRFFKFDKDKGFFLNGKSIKLKGCNIHQDYPGLGPTGSERFQYEEMKLMKEMGCNYMRASHYPRNERCLQACDELGIMVMEEQPFWHGSARVAQGENFVNNSRRLVREMVKQHGNHPSIIIWNTANEIMWLPDLYRVDKPTDPWKLRSKKWTLDKEERLYAKRVISEMYNSIKEADPYRPISYVVGAKWKLNDKIGITSIPEIVGYNGGVFNFQSEPHVDSETNKEYNFIPDYYREKYPERIGVMTEGIINDNKCMYKRADWEQENVVWQRQAKYWNKIYKRDWLSGGTMWCFTDYYANADYRIKGAMDVSRLPKEIYYFYKAMWYNQPVLHILGHWDNNKKTKDKRNIIVFTNCNSIELLLNDKSLGNGKSVKNKWPEIPNPPIIWENIQFEPGCLQVNGEYDGKTFEDKRITSSKPHQIKIQANSEIIKADGRDISFIKITILDKDGNRCYLSFNEIEIDVKGASYLAGNEKQIARGGLLKFVVRSKGDKGKAYINISGEGLISNSMEIDCI